MKATLDFFECRKFSQGKKEFINFFSNVEKIPYFLEDFMETFLMSKKINIFFNGSQGVESLRHCI